MPTHDESGITLVEIAVSLAILGLVLTAFFTVITGGLQSLSESRSRQAASQVATEVIETLRGVAPSQIAMDSDDFNPLSVSCDGTTGEFAPDGDAPTDCEVVRSASLGAITQSLPYTGDVAAVSGTVRTYATTATGSDVPGGTVRVTVLVEYELPGGSDEVRRSALFSEVDRG